MKPYTLLIDVSASSPIFKGSELYVYEADTILDAMDKLKELNLEFNPGKIYCATIGQKKDNEENRYFTILRTDTGRTWYREKESSFHSFYCPETWPGVHDWTDIEYYKHN